MTMPDDLLWQTPLAVPDRTGQHCPCGGELKRPSEWCYGICDQCRIEAHRRPRRHEPTPDYVDVPLPLDWGQP